MFGVCYQRRMTVCVRMGKCCHCNILLCSFPCCWLCEAAGRRRSAAPPGRRSLVRLSLCSWSTPQSNVWGWGCLCQTQICNHTNAKGKKTDRSSSKVTASTTNTVVKRECETMDATAVLVKPAAEIPPFHFHPSFMRSGLWGQPVHLFTCSGQWPVCRGSHGAVPTHQTSKEVLQVRTFPTKPAITHCQRSQGRIAYLWCQIHLYLIRGSKNNKDNIHVKLCRCKASPSRERDTQWTKPALPILDKRQGQPHNTTKAGENLAILCCWMRCFFH